MTDLKLYCLPLGESMRAQFIEEAKHYSYGEALFVVPGRFLGQQVKKTGIIRSVIMDYLPNEILRLNNYAGDFIRISRVAQEMMLADIIGELSEAGRLSYFGKIAAKKGFVKNVAALISELARGAVRGVDLEEAFAAWNRTGNYGLKDKEIALIYATYTKRLQETNLYDIDGLYRLALFILQQEEAVVPWQCLYFSEFYQLNELQLTLIKALSKYCHIKIGLFYDPSKPLLTESTKQTYEDLMGLNFIAEEVSLKTPRVADLQYLVEGWKISTILPQLAQHVELLEAYSLEHEMSMVLMKIKHLITEGAAPESIICLVRNLDDYNGLSNKFREYGVPTALQNVTNFSGQQLPDFLTRLLAVALNPMDVEGWKHLLSHYFSEVLYGINKDIVEESYNTHCFTTVQSLLSYVSIQEQVDLTPLTDLVKKLGAKQTAQEQADILQESIEQWQLLSRWGEAYKQDKCSLEDVKILAQTQEKVLSILDSFVLAMEQSGMKTRKINADVFATYWRENIIGITLPLTSGNSCGVQVLEVTNVQAVPFAHVFILGMREGVFPNIKSENWLYNDGERAELVTLGIPLKISPIAVNQERFFFASALAMATESLTLSYYADDQAGASSYVEELRQCFTQETLQPQSWQHTVDNCASKQMLLQLLAAESNLDATAKNWSEAYWGKNFMLKKTLDTMRWQDNSAYNGALGVNKLPKQLNSSALDDYLQCPFAYLVKRIWHLDKWQQLTDEVQAATKGTICHNVLAEFLGRYLGVNLSVNSLVPLRQELTEIFTRVYESFREQGAIAEGVYAEYERQAMLNILLRWLEKEYEYQSNINSAVLPTALEQPFGSEDTNSWPPLKLHVGGEILSFSGKIDRIDSDGNQYFITDYKTGANPDNLHMSKGQALQLPIYIMALSETKNITADNIMGAGYFSLKTGKRQNGTWHTELRGNLPWYSKLHRSPELNEVLVVAEESILSCVDKLKHGNFAAAPMDACAGYCPAIDVCRYRLSKVSQEGDGEHEQ